MCPICWISGFIAILFGGSFIATINHPISWILGILLISYSIYQFYEAKQRGNKMTDDTKQKNRKTIFRFVQGVVIGSLVTIIIFYNLVNKFHNHEQEHEHGHKQIEQPMPNDLEVVENSIIIFYNPSEKEHKKLHKWLSRKGIVHKHQ